MYDARSRTARKNFVNTNSSVPYKEVPLYKHISTLYNHYVFMNVCGSYYENGCMVNGMCAMAAD